MLRRDGKAWVALLLAASFAATAQAWAEEAQAQKDWSAELTLDFYRKYVWRGQLLTDDDNFWAGVSVGLSF